MRELQAHELQILTSAIHSTESKQEMAKALWNPEIMVSMGISTEMVREFDTKDLKENLERFMVAFDIEEEEYENVLAFYGKVYAIMRAQVESEEGFDRVQKAAPGIWERRLKFIEDSGFKKGRTRKSLSSCMVPYLMEKYQFSFYELNNHDLTENALCYLVSTASLNAIHVEATARTIDYLWDEMEDRTWFDLYTDLRKSQSEKAECKPIREGEV